tara:strand:- start:104 stop:3169 length:3066 start_codon:yes stop_codon:yes gene_type:complete
MKLMSILLLVFAFFIGYATFIENDFGRTTAKALVFNSWWLEAILILLTFSLINNIIKFRLFRWEKIAALTFHLAFIIILIGSSITRYISYEGMMHIREGESTNLFISDDTFLQIHIDDRIHQYKYEKKLFLSGVYQKEFDVNVNFKDNDISIESVRFLPNVEDSLLKQEVVGLTIRSKNPKLTSKVGTNISINDMITKSLSSGKEILFKDSRFTLNNPNNSAFNFYTSKGILKCIPPTDVDVMSMPPDGRGATAYMRGDTIEITGTTLINVNTLKFVISDIQYNGEKVLYSSSNIMNDGSEDALVLNIHANGASKEITLYGGKGYRSNSEVFAIGDLNFSLNYGSKYYSSPFRIALRDFQLERYPGSMSPSSYAAEVTVLDGDLKKDYRIFMNNVLNYKGYRFFQSSYDKDEKGTILSVNHDWWGTLITYIGYFFLGLGFILVFLTKNTRYRALTKKLDKLPLLLLFIFYPFISFSAEETSLKSFNTEHISKFDALVVQDNGGRLKPVHTLTSEYLRKISGKDKFEDQSATEVILGMMYNTEYWRKQPIIKVSHKKARVLLSSNDMDSKYIKVPFNNFLDKNGHYLLAKDVKLAHEKLPKDRDQYDKDLIRVDERVNICFAIYSGGIFRLFPLPNDTNNTWYSYKESFFFNDKDSLFVSSIMPYYFQAIREGFNSNNWEQADTMITYIKKFQLRYGKDVLPVQNKIDAEICYNKVSIFSSLFMYYFLSGIILLTIIIVSLFQRNTVIDYLIRLLKWIIVIGFISHTIGLALRWYISEHAPWSNGYESMIYIAWTTILAGLIYTKRSILTLAATAVIAGLLLMVAHLNWLDPEITNLVPVLNSYWLMIHVAIITSSYGFFSLGAILGLISLWLIIFTNAINKPKLATTLQEITIINEKTLEVGLFMLAIGTFLGGVWANESWGRYWGWDPKETWALVSILIYSFILHMRFIPPLKGVLTFNMASMFAIWTIIMTYFGVNYYLSGLHSYAAGDPMPIPDFVYYLFGLMLITAILAKVRYKKNY